MVPAKHCWLCAYGDIHWIYGASYPDFDVANWNEPDEQTGDVCQVRFPIISQNYTYDKLIFCGMLFVNYKGLRQKAGRCRTKRILGKLKEFRLEPAVSLYQSSNKFLREQMHDENGKSYDTSHKQKRHCKSSFNSETSCSFIFPAKCL